LFDADIWMYMPKFTQHIVLKGIHIIQKVQHMNSVQHLAGRLWRMIDGRW